MHWKYAEMLDIVVHENMKLPEQWEVLTFWHKLNEL